MHKILCIAHSQALRSAPSRPPAASRRRESASCRGSCKASKPRFYWAARPSRLGLVGRAFGSYAVFVGNHLGDLLGVGWRSWDLCGVAANKQKKLTLNFFKYLHPTPPNEPKNRTSPGSGFRPCALSWNKNMGTSDVEQESWGQATWRASPDVPCRHSWRHVFAGITSTPVSPRVSRPVCDKKQTKSNEK